MGQPNLPAAANRLRDHECFRASGRRQPLVHPYALKLPAGVEQFLHRPGVLSGPRSEAEPGRALPGPPSGSPRAARGISRRCARHGHLHGAHYATNSSPGCAQAPTVLCRGRQSSSDLIIVCADRLAECSHEPGDGIALAPQGAGNAPRCRPRQRTHRAAGRWASGPPVAGHRRGRAASKRSG